MNDVLISNILETVKPEDTLYILGDFAFKKEDFEHYRGILEEACQLVFCQGNHDNKSMNYQLATDFKYNKMHYYLSHYAWQTWRPGTVMLHGHCHGSPLPLPSDSRQQWRWDVGVDTNWTDVYVDRYYPIPITAVEARIDATR